MRNSGVIRCASEVKRSVRSALALAVICSSFVDIRFLLLSVGDGSLTQLSTCSAASPCTRLSRAPSTNSGSDFLWMVLSVGILDCQAAQSRPQWISQVPRRFLFRPCRALRPRRSLRPPRFLWELTGAFQVFDLVGLRFM